MKTLPTLILLIFISLTIPVHSINSCQPVTCDRFGQGPVIRFPFRLSNLQPASCGYPGFDLHCNSQNQTILTLPKSGEFTVQDIDYTRQAIYLDDPDFCLPNRVMNFSTEGSRFSSYSPGQYTFMNCSENLTEFPFPPYVTFECLSGRNYTVLASTSRLTDSQLPNSCRRIKDVIAPVHRMDMFDWAAQNMGVVLELVWPEPICSDCESRGGICGYSGNPGSDIGCSTPPRRGLSRGAKYGIIVGIGIPGTVCMIGLVCYFCGMVRSFGLDQRGILNSDHPTIRVSELRLTVRSTSGLDGPTIESYPKLVIGDSFRLPKATDTTCPICLTDYEPKDTLRSIPACNHFFHLECIDEWLKLNGTCPLCRNSPESSMCTPHSSMSLPSSPSATSDS